MSRRDPRIAADVEPEPVEWLWPTGMQGRIPKATINLLAGRPDQGKGLMATYIAADITKRKGNVLISAAEDHPGMMTRPRLEAAGADLKRVVLWQFALPLMFEQLTERIVEANLDLVIIDPLNAHLSMGVSRGSDSIRKVTEPMEELCETFGVTFLIIDHALKRVPKHADPLSAIGGTGSGMPAAARSAHFFGRDPKDADSRLFCTIKLNVGERPVPMRFETDVEEHPIAGPVPFLLFQEETVFNVQDLVSTSQSSTPGRPPDKRADAAEWLSRILYESGKPMPAGQVFEDAKHVPLSAKTVRRAADDMGIIREPKGRGCKWRLPADIKEALDEVAEDQS